MKKQPTKIDCIAMGVSSERIIIREKLIAESERFKQLAMSAALSNLLNRDNIEATTKAREHLIRAETFRAAANLIPK